VNCPASHVKAPGNSRCWISAANDNGTERCPPLEQIGVAAVRNHHVRQKVPARARGVHKLGDVPNLSISRKIE
jgi:hypothetical protein